MFSPKTLDMIPLSLRLWTLRALVVGGLISLCWLSGSGDPALASAVAWGPNGLFLVAFTRGALRLPLSLVRVHPIEPVIYRWIGVGLVKRIVATRTWPLLNGFDPTPRARSRQELLDRTELTTRGSEVCHAATFVVASLVAWSCLAVGRSSMAVWIMAFNVVLNGYPVMLQRANRWRVHQVRALMRRDHVESRVAPT